MDFYLITAGDIRKLDQAAKRLYTEDRMDGDTMRDMAQVLDAIRRGALAWDGGDLPQEAPVNG